MKETLYVEFMWIYKRKICTNPVVLGYQRYTENAIKRLVDKIADPRIACINGFLDKKTLKKVRRYMYLPTSGGKSLLYRSLLERLTALSQNYDLGKKTDKDGPIDLNTPITSFFFTNRTYTGVIMGLIDKKRINDMVLEDLIEFAYNPDYLKMERIGESIQKEVRELVKSCGYPEPIKLKR